MELIDVSKFASPYTITYSPSEQSYKFVTDYDVEYAVSFMEDEILDVDEVFHFIVSNTKRKASPRDIKVRDTITAILDAFFQQRQSAIIYICETGDGKQSMRNRLFHYWFSRYKHSNECMFLSSAVIDEEGVMNYATLVIRNDNPNLTNVLNSYTTTIQLLSQKP